MSGINSIYFVGIGGISMSSLAKLCMVFGKKVSGSDKEYNAEVEKLMAMGVDVCIGSNENAVKNSDIIVYSLAVANDNKELLLAKEYGIPTIPRNVFLGEICKEFDKTIAVCGTHGKSTTTAMISAVFEVAERPFSTHIGGNMGKSGNMIYKGKEVFITEACEYKRSFLSLNPTFGVILNAEFDHPDCYKNTDEVYQAFDDFGDKCINKKRIVINGDCNYYRMRKDKYALACTFGLNDDDNVVAKNLVLNKNGGYDFQIYYNGMLKTDISLLIPGKFNVYNALACYTVCSVFGLDEGAIKKGLNSFYGVDRRFEFKGFLNGTKVYTDYAHHPTEIANTIQAVKEMSVYSKIKAVFQPHTYSRTKALKEEFEKCFEFADEVIIFKEYSARESSSDGMCASELYRRIKRRGCKALYYNESISLCKYLTENVEPNQILLIMGAGNICNIVDILPIR